MDNVCRAFLLAFVTLLVPFAGNPASRPAHAAEDAVLSNKQGRAQTANAGARVALTTPRAMAPRSNTPNVSYADIPMRFEPAPGDRTEFEGTGPGYRLSLLPQEVVVNLITQEDAHATLRLRLIEANPRTRVRGQDRLPGGTFFLEGRDPAKWRTNVPSYSRVKYEGIYPGVDLVFYGNQNQLEYDFVVAPGADLNLVRLEVEGAEHVRLNENGSIILSAAAGEVTLRKPFVYQQDGDARREVGGDFRVRGNRISFAVGAYDPKKTLIVDPVLNYATYVGRSVNDAVKGIALGPDGSTYAAGVAPAAAATSQDEAFVTHLSADGKTLLYRTYLGGAGASSAHGIALDQNGNAFITGESKAADFPILNAFQPSCARDAAGKCSGDAFLVKLNPDGSLNFSSYLGGAGEDTGNAIALDSAGSAYIAGATTSTDFPTIRAVQPAASGRGDGFIAKFSNDGSRLVYSTFLGGSGADQALGIAVDGTGSAYITGQTQSFDFPAKNAFAPQCRLANSGQCAGEAFVTKLSPDGGELVWSTYLGGSGGDSGNALAVDAAGSAYVAGATASDDFPVSNPFQQTRHGALEAFATKFLPDGSGLVYSTFLGGLNDDQATGIAVDQQGNAYISGHTASPDFPTQAPVQAECRKSSNAACQDAFLAVLNSKGTGLRFSTFLGGTGTEQGYGIAVDEKGSAYLGGATESADFPNATSATQVAAERHLVSLNSATSTGSAAAATPGVPGGIVAMISGLISDAQANCSGSINWTGAAGNNQWTTATNWDKGVLPATTDTVCIGPSFSNATITIGSITATSNQTIASLVSNANISFTAGPLTVTGGANFVNALSLTGGTLTLSGTNGSTIGGAMTLSNATLAGTDTVTIAGLLTWGSNGSMCTAAACNASGTGVTNANGGITYTTGYVYLYGRTLNNGATATWSETSGYYLALAYGAVINNRSGATWQYTNDYPYLNTSTGGGTFNNAGTFEKTGGTGITNIYPAYNQTAGTTFLGSGSFAFASSPQIQGGTLTGSGTISGNYTGSVSTSPAGAIAPGTAAAVGSITLTGTGSGNYTAGTGAFTVKIGGTGAGQFDTLTASGTANVAGATLNAGIFNGYTPNTGDSFTILTAAGGVSGKFTTLNIPNGWQVSYTPTTVILSVGQGSGPTATLSTNGITFPNTIVNQTSAPIAVTLANTGNAPLIITSIAPTGADAANYAYHTDAAKPCPIAPATLAQGTSCNIDVVFTPTSAGTHNSAQITITDNSGGTAGATQTISLQGTGIVLSSIAITAASTSLAMGSSEQFTATGTYSDNSTANLTTLVSWNSGTPAVATISAAGLATAVSPGTTNITASLGGVTSNTFTLSVPTVATVGIVALSGSGQSATVGTAFANPLVALVQDSNGNPVPNVTVTFTAPATGASGTFANGTNTITAVTDAAGHAASGTFTANTTANATPYQVTATAQNVTGTAAFTLTNNPASGASIVAVSGTPQQAAPGATFQNPLQVQVLDTYGNGVSGVTVTFIAPGTGASGTFAGGVNTAVTNAAGFATSAAFTANGFSGSYTVTANVTGVSSPANFQLTNTNPVLGSIMATGGTPQSTTVNNAFGAVLQATVTDSNGSPVGGEPVTFAVQPAANGAGSTFPGSVTTFTAMTNSSGVASSPVLTANTVAGSYAVTATTGMLSASFALTNLPGAAAAVTVTGGTPQSAQIGMQFALPLQASVTDSFGNPVSGASVTFTAPASGPSGTFAGAGAAFTGITNASGVVTSPAFTANGTANAPNTTYTVTAMVGGVTTAANFILTNLPGPAGTITAASGTPQSAQILTTFATSLQAVVKDSANNPVANVTVTFTAPANGASGAFATGGATASAVTDSTGTATAPAFTANTTAGSYSVTASAPNVSTPASFSLTNLPGPAAVINSTAGTPQSTLVNTAFATNLQATVLDAHNNPVNGATVTFTVVPASSGAGGTFAGGVNTAITNAQGQATAAVFTANGIPGTYSVIASTGNLTPATFSLTNNSAQTGPQVVSYKVLFGSQGYNVIGSARNRLPWQISGIQVVFSEPIVQGNANSLTGLTTTSISGLGTNTLTWTISPVALGSFATALAGSGPNALEDAAGNSLASGGFQQTLNVLWGDINDDGVVNAQDLVLANDAISGAYNIFADMNGDGVVNATDVSIIRTLVGNSLP